MKTVWLDNLSKDEVANIQATLNNSAFIRQFAKLLSAKKEMLERKGLKEDDYLTNDWQALQAFNNGRLAMLLEIVDLLTP